MRKTAILPLLAVTLFALLACGGNKSSNAGSSSASADQSVANSAPVEQQAASIPNCGALAAVWVNLKSRVYHEPSDRLYGKTRQGEYLCPDQAKAQGFRPARAHHRHHRRTGSSSDGSM